MKKAFLLYLLAFCCSISSAFSQSFPPNTVQINDSLFVDQTEIANIHWLEYLYHLKKDSSSEQFKAALPDTTVWLDLSEKSLDSACQFDKFVSIYIRHPRYRYFPIVGISHQQARNYCRWRSAMVNNHFMEDENWDGHVVNYRLPTETEWELAASGGLDLEKYPHGYENDGIVKVPSYDFLKSEVKYAIEKEKKGMLKS
ncbi:MAG: SUMF1/EgtB/PvdO family nonheme iron enzyme, partial [Bacteroidota bacterium]